MRKICAVLGILSLSLTAVNCGYTTGSMLPSHLRTIHITPFKNSIDFAAAGRRNIYLPLLEVDVRNEVISRYQFDGHLKITDESKADLILKGELKEYHRNPLRYTDNDTVEEYRLQIIVSLELWDTKTNELRWQEPSFGGDTEYFVTGASAKSEAAAVKDAIEDLARRIVERTIEDW